MPSAFSLLLAASFVTNTHAWGALGHMLVAQIALNRISTQTSQQTATLVAELATYYTKSPDFVTAAVSTAENNCKILFARRFTECNHGGYWADVLTVSFTSLMLWIATLHHYAGALLQSLLCGDATYYRCSCLFVW